MQPRVEILALGTELISGLIQDTNSSFLAARLTELGGDVARITALPDDPEVMLTEFGAACDRGAAVVLTCGGLGPTPDDLTVETLCQFAGVKPVVEESLIDSFMARRGIARREEVTPNLVKMATVPQGCTVHPAAVGWAPCLELTCGDTTFFSLPGPPRELEALFAEHVGPLLAKRFGRRRVTDRVGVTMHESEVSPHLQTVMADHPGTYLKAYVALRAATGEPLPVDISATGADLDEARAQVDSAVEQLRTLVEANGQRLVRV